MPSSSPGGGSQIRLEDEDHIHALQAALSEEIRILKSANGAQISSVRENHEEARQRIQRHCKALSESVEKREKLLLKEIEHLERVQIREIEAKNSALDQLRTETTSPGKTIDRKRVESILQIFPANSKANIERKGVRTGLTLHRGGMVFRSSLCPKHSPLLAS